MSRTPAGAYWLIDEIALAQRYEKRVAAEEFQHWKLTVKDDHTATLACDDGNGNVVYSKRIRSRIFRLRRSRSIAPTTPSCCRASIDRREAVPKGAAFSDLTEWGLCDFDRGVRTAQKLSTVDRGHHSRTSEVECHFTPEELAELSRGQGEAHEKFADLRERYFVRNYENDRAKDFAFHGFGRRLGTLIRCIDQVFAILPPDREGIPSRDEVVDATIYIQAFVLNIFGCLDNLAWIWVSEKDIKNKDGSELGYKSIGLGNKQVRSRFSQPFRSYLDSLEPWFIHMKDFRDALAHRIPLYIPPFIVAPDRIDEYQRLGAAAHEAARLQNVAEYDRLTAEQDALGVFRPWMTHSRAENAPVQIFHRQLLADFNTIDEIGRKLLEEMERPYTKPSAT